MNGSSRIGGISFAGKVVLVTGAAGGIGRAAALAFGRAGACVVVADTSVDGGHATAAMIVEAGGKALFVQCNVTRENEVEALIDKTVSYYGKLDCAFNNAGVEDEHQPLAEADEALYDKIMAVNVKGAWLCMKYEIRQMLKQGGGAIVNTASVAGLAGAPMRAIYAASKHAVVGMTKTAALEYGRQGIRINSVCPGLVDTPMLARSFKREPGREERMLETSPIGRIGQAAEIAEAAMWLCSEHASFVTGHQLAVDGGLTAI
ncbi:SDR family oxidoreductase [Massilia cavernae]|uniref:SDR family oxidoreductase n=1 Tax=Massilia cavernae TaxID=2320864 RepID=A0A418Y4E1_9BURK|nr:SDR family oxidoreductase [Massilia cavernae]RJG20584.1 SDR family oxidoreductase [Massilia cavernae]